MFINRQHAGLLLAKQLKDLTEKKGQLNARDLIVLALPCGGLPVALEIAMMLDCPLDLIVSKKIGAPNQPELAIGAVTSDGVVILDDYLIEYLQVPQTYLDDELAFLMRKTKEQESTLRRLSGLTEVQDFKGKDIIVVDDGVATGMTAVAAAYSLRNRGAKQLVFATPVASYQAYTMLRKEYDPVVALDVSQEFKSVGQFYKDFSQVEDMEVMRALSVAGNKQKVRQS